jgi:hypothetical protein
MNVPGGEHRLARPITGGLAITGIEDKMYSLVWILSKPQSRKGRLTYGRVGKHGF